MLVGDAKIQAARFLNGRVVYDGYFTLQVNFNKKIIEKQRKIVEALVLKYGEVRFVHR